MWFGLRLRRCIILFRTCGGSGGAGFWRCWVGAVEEGLGKEVRKEDREANVMVEGGKGEKGWSVVK